jgi:6-phosphogluconolactonase
MIKSFKSAEDLCRAAMDMFIDLAKESIGRAGKFSVVLSGGRTPNLLYDMLAQPINASKVDWKNVFVFWGDERYVDYNNADNNAFQAKEHLLDHVNIPQANIFRIPVTGDYRADAISYEKSIRQFFQGSTPAFDLVFLGMGEEGHTASLFPGSDLLEEEERLVRDVYVEIKQMQRISFTPPLINAAKHIVFMITGTEKAAAYNAVSRGAFNPTLFPAQIIKPTRGKITWLLGEEVLK